MLLTGPIADVDFKHKSEIQPPRIHHTPNTPRRYLNVIIIINGYVLTMIVNNETSYNESFSPTLCEKRHMKVSISESLENNSRKDIFYSVAAMNISWLIDD